jgi:hypothetical protein
MAKEMSTCVDLRQDGNFERRSFGDGPIFYAGRSASRHDFFQEFLSVSRLFSEGILVRKLGLG